MIDTYLNLFLGVAEHFAIFICIGIFMWNNEREIARKKQVYLFCLLFCVFSSFFLTIMGQASGQYWYSLAFQFIIIPVAGALLFHKKLQNLFLDFVFSVIIFLAVETGIYVMNYILFISGCTDYIALGNLAITIKIICMALVTLFSTVFLRQCRRVHLKKRQAALILLLPLFSFFFFFSLLEMSTVYVQLKNITLILSNVIALVLLNFYFLYLWGYFLRSKELETTLCVFQAQKELQYRHYGQLEEKYKESRKIIHDMKNHLSAIEHLYRQESAISATPYVEDLYHMLNVMGEKYYSENPMLNIICNDKLAYAQQKGILVTTEIGDTDFSDLRDIDITTIFANLLDNAIEAAQETSEPYLKIKIQTIQNFRIISLVNSSPAALKKKGHMGLGLENVKHTVQQYSGTITTEQSEQEYRVSIMLPGKESL